LFSSAPLEWTSYSGDTSLLRCFDGSDTKFA
jgi:hypothetical protein